MAFFQLLAAQPHILLFTLVAIAAALGQMRFRGLALGTMSSASLVGAGLSITSASFGVILELSEITKLFACYLFMYAVGLCIGPAFVNSFDREGSGFAIVAVITSVTGLLAAITVSRFIDSPEGMDVGLLAGALTETGAIGTAEGAVVSGAAPIPEGMTAQQLSANATVGYSLTYVFGSIGIILMVRLLPRIFGIDGAAAARAYEEEHRMASDGSAYFHPDGPTSLRAVEVVNPEADGQPLHAFRTRFEGCRAIAHFRDGDALAIDADSRLEHGDVLATVGPHDRLVSYVRPLGREFTDPTFPKEKIDHAEGLVFRSENVGRKMHDVGGELGFGFHLNALRRSGQEQPWGPDTVIKRGDVLDITGDRVSLEKPTAAAGSRAQFGLVTDLMTLGVGILLGLLTVNVAGIEFGLGSAASVLVAGVVIASLRERIPVFGNTPTAARQLLEDIGLTVFVVVIGVNAAAHMLDGETLDLAIKILLGGIVVSTLPPLLARIEGVLHLSHERRLADGRDRRRPRKYRAGQGSNKRPQEQRSMGGVSYPVCGLKRPRTFLGLFPDGHPMSGRVHCSIRNQKHGRLDDCLIAGTFLRPCVPSRGELMPYRKPLCCLAAIFSLLSLTSAAGAQDTPDFAEVCRKVISETIYIPAPSKVQTKEKSVEQLASTLVVHNVDPDATITLVSVASYDETGKLFESRLSESVTVASFASKSFLTAIDDDRGGTGANYTVEWQSEQGACSPLVLAVMVGGAGTQGISFSLEGRVIQRQYATDP